MINVTLSWYTIITRDQFFTMKEKSEAAMSMNFTIFAAGEKDEVFNSKLFRPHLAKGKKIVRKYHTLKRRHYNVPPMTKYGKQSENVSTESNVMAIHFYIFKSPIQW